MLGLPPPTVVLPAAVAAPTRALLGAFTALDGNPMACELLPLDPGGEAELVPGHVVRPFATFHPVPSQARPPAHARGAGRLEVSPRCERAASKAGAAWSQVLKRPPAKA
jgi:hypothetical protein